METHSEFVPTGLTLSRRGVLPGTDLEPKYALIKVRRALEDHSGQSSGDASQGELEFDERAAASISVTGMWFPSIVSGEVRAEAIPDGIAVTASADLSRLFLGVVITLIGIRLVFGYAGLTNSILFTIALALVPAAAALDLWQIARVLRVVTTAGTTR